MVNYICFDETDTPHVSLFLHLFKTKYRLQKHFKIIILRSAITTVQDITEQESCLHFNSFLVLSCNFKLSSYLNVEDHLCEIFLTLRSKVAPSNLKLNLNNRSSPQRKIEFYQQKFFTHLTSWIYAFLQIVVI